MKRLLILLLGGAALAAPVALAQSVVVLINSDLFEPYGVAVDTNNNYYITDSGNNRIVEFMAGSNGRTNFAGAPGFAGRGYADGPGYLARFNNPEGIVAARGGFVVADSGNNRIRFVGLDSTVSTLAGNGSTGFTDNTNGLNAAFNSPAGLAADAAGNIYIADLVNGAIRKLDLNNAVTTVATGFLRPSAVAVDNTGRIFVADSGNNAIEVISPGGAVSLLAGSGSGQISGYLDNYIATHALFNNPRGLFWVGGTNNTLVVSDSGNQVLRRIYYNAGVGTNSVDTLPGTGNGLLLSPVGLAQDNNGNLLIVDLRAGALLQIVATQPQQKITSPVIGTVTLVLDQNNNPSAVITAVTNATFNNDVVVAISAEPGTETFYTRDGSDPSAANGATPPPFQVGQTTLPTSIIDTTIPHAAPNTTLKAISVAQGRPSSDVVTAVFNFAVANPAIIGNNPGAVTLQCATTNALIYYTTDGTDPTTGSALYTLGTRLNIVNGTNDIVLKVRAFKNGYANSAVVAQTFYFNNLQTSSIGIVRDFVAGVGATIVVPVVAKLNTNDVLKTVQFRVEVTPNGGAPALPTSLSVLPITTNDFIQVTPPGTNAPLALPYNLGSATGLEVGYLSSNVVEIVGGATVAMVAVSLPTNAVVGQTYSVGVLYPSGTSDGFQTPVVLSALTNRTITISNIAYVVGDSAQATWYNAGDFGNGNLNNNDVINAFNASIGIRVPYAVSDVFDAMDAYPEDTPGSVGGDGQITFLDWQVIFDRSLRVNVNNWQRAWGGPNPLKRTNTVATLNGSPLLPAQQVAANPAALRPWYRDATVQAGVVEYAQPGTVVSVPVALNVVATQGVSGLQFLASVQPGAGAPPLTTAPQFLSARGFAPANFSAAQTAAVGCGWLVGGLGQTVTGSGTVVGHVTFTVPPGAQPGQSYSIHFLNPDGSTRTADGTYAFYRFQSVPGTVWVQTSAQTPPNVISDEWRTHFFGSLTNVLSDPTADPDGDGVNNLQEFLAGSNPLKARFQLLSNQWRDTLPDGLLLKWLASPGAAYTIQSATDPVNGPWTPVGQLTAPAFGPQQYLPPAQPGQPRLFYRIQENF